ncbi:transcription-repair coupling factor [Desulfurivibrio sp. C05AmB]|jgi:transcription-repair coupling factor (superfamily II helicase)|uniref:transcription-repair coupling factor n=1 Tax=Desulfurivibrio sp. C05AmB TaxID=3374371 RepID=UPI00376F3794
MNHILDALGRSSTPLDLYGLRGGAAAWFAGLAGGLGRPLLCLCPSPEEARLLAEDLGLFSTLPVIFYPDAEVPPYAPLRTDPGVAAAQTAALYQALSATGPFVFVACAVSLLGKTQPGQELNGLAELLISGEESDPRQLLERLAAGGYEQAALVQEVGEYSVRGGIIDIFAPGREYPLRLDFFGDTVESIRHFDPVSQRSIEELAEVIILPVGDTLYPAADSPAHRAMLGRFRRLTDERGWDRAESARLLDCLQTRRPFAGDRFFLPLFQPAAVSPLSYLPAATLILALDYPRLRQGLSLHDERVRANFQELEAAAKPALAPAELFLSAAELLEQLAARPGARLLPLGGTDPDNRRSFTVSAGNHVLLKQELDLARPSQGLLAPLARRIQQWQTRGEQVFLACRSPRHAAQMEEMLNAHGVACRRQTESGPPPGMVDRQALSSAASRELILAPQPLSSGFDLVEEKLHWLSEAELFGERRLGAAKTRRRAPAEKISHFDEINPGDLVVHRRHGIGIYQGLTPIELGGITNDYLEIRYRGEDKLFIPVDQINSVGKYKGVAEQEPNLDKLGDKTWLATRNRIKKAVWQVARDLLNLYAKRQLAAGTTFSAPGEMYHELEESFPFDETPGQLQAINEVMDDLCSDRPMDRLVCGDVGYGKTEVAVRAAFKVVEDGAQVALLVPTTVLAEQHAATFRERLAGFPLRVESLNRFRSLAEQKKIVAQLAAGQVDIVIGTHRLLSADVKFKKLGLLIIDEEHRFGVGHKERLKRLRAGVDVLTLTATPIPRTLQLSLLGVRDLSVISSPPSLRRTVKTFIARHDDLVIREAIHRELGRDGQVFVVHNRVQNIHEVAAKVQQLVPEARVAVAHGQMPGKQLEEIMVRFVRREINVLVCTTIIESGLDIPSANTIIITRADRLGLAEIYQLRGRVGRSSEQAYAYLLVPALDDLAGEARRRLQALMDYNELGGGFKLALSDLQIRGGGNILGESQSGNIAAVGYDMYLELLQKTVLDLKRRARQPDAAGGDAPPEETMVEEEIEPEIKLAIAAHIPADYIEDVNQRYLAYRKITAAADDPALADIQDEFADRFGPLPPETANLFEIISLKNRLAKLGISKLEQGPAALVFSFHPSTPVPPERILALVNQRRKGLRFTPQARLISPLPPKPSIATLFNEIKKLLRALMGDDIPQ